MIRCPLQIPFRELTSKGSAHIKCDISDIYPNWRKIGSDGANQACRGVKTIIFENNIKEAFQHVHQSISLFISRTLIVSGQEIQNQNIAHLRTSRIGRCAMMHVVIFLAKRYKAEYRTSTANIAHRRASRIGRCHSSDQKLRDFRPRYLTKNIIIREYLNLGKYIIFLPF